MSEIPIEAYKKIEIYLGKGKADEIANQVRKGEITVEAAINIGNQQELLYKETRGRKDIDPKDWPKFEEGWRP